MASSNSKNNKTVVALPQEWSSVMYLTDVGGATAIFHESEVVLDFLD